MGKSADKTEEVAATHAYRTRHSVVTADGWKTARCLDAFCKRSWPKPDKKEGTRR